MRRGAILVLLAISAALVVAVAPIGLGVAAAAAVVLAGGFVMRPGTQTAADRELPRRDAGPSPAVVPPAAAAGWIETLPCGVLLLDGDLIVVAANEAALTLCARTRDDVEGASLIRAIRDHNITQIARESAGVPQEVDVRDGQTVRVTAARLEQPIAGARHLLALEDLTELRHAQRARSDLVANASHELRTPVTAALALAETLEEGVADEARRGDFHARLTSEVSRLRDIIEGLLNLSRLEANSDEFNIESLSPAALLETAVGRIDPLLGPGQSVRHVDQSVGLVDGDRERVLEVLANLLENALHVSPDDGVVTLSAFDGDHEVRFEVNDQGPGIMPRDRARVFERFYTGEESRTDSHSSGLGLAIARHIVSRLGGRIWVGDQSPGATLCFTLPRREGGATPEDGEPATGDGAPDPGVP